MKFDQIVSIQILHLPVRIHKENVTLELNCIVVVLNFIQHILLLTYSNKKSNPKHLFYQKELFIQDILNETV